MTERNPGQSDGSRELGSVLKIQCALAGFTPTRQSRAAAGMDLHYAGDTTVLHPGQRAALDTGTRVAIEDGFVGMVCSRSGLAAKHGVHVLNAPGIIDPDYRGDLKVILCNSGAEPVHINHGDRIAQLLVIPCWFGQPEVVDLLDETERGEAGLGSTGVGHAAT